MTARPLDFTANDEPPPSTAASWYARKRSGAMTANEARELDAWLDQAPENRAAYDEIEHFWDVAGDARADPEMMALREAAARARPRRRPAVWGTGIAATLALAAFGGWQAWRSGAFAPPQMQAFRTGVGQTTTVVLKDGSEVTLDTDSLVRTQLSGRVRQVELVQGQAYFKVAKDHSRPFVVAAAGKTVTATGTQFDVRLDPGRLQVTLVEGKVRVEAPREPFRPGQSADMLAGWRLVAEGDHRWRVSQADAARDVSWLHGQLTFSNQPMSEVVAEMNRYSARKIVIADSKLAGKPVIGAFRAGDVGAFAEAVETYRLGRVARRSEAEIELTSR